MFDFPGMFFLLLLLFVLGWLTRRAWRAKRSAVKWLGATLAGLLALMVSCLLGAASFGYWKLNRTYDNPVPQLSVAVTPERVARGKQFEHLCAGCHAPDTSEAMTGRDFLGEDAPPDRRFLRPKPDARSSR